MIGRLTDNVNNHFFYNLPMQNTAKGQHNPNASITHVTYHISGILFMLLGSFILISSVYHFFYFKQL